MPRVVHVVTTTGFAGVERYVCDVAGASASRGWEVTVIGGDRERMLAALDGTASWEPGGSIVGALRSLRELGRVDVCHAHMTIAETVAVVGRPLHRAPIVATRHFAAHRGASLAGRIAGPWIAARISREIAVGEFVASRVERRPDAVIAAGVRPSPCLWRAESRSVVLLQRLESEKDTLTALRAWERSQLADEGWVLRVYGEGSERDELERWVADHGVRGVAFEGWTNDVPAVLSGAGILLATAVEEPFGLSVLDAMVAGIPVAAAASGGHLETVGLIDGAALFPPRDAEAAATTLRGLLAEPERTRLSAAGRELTARRFTIEGHVDALLAEYDDLLATRRGPVGSAVATPTG